MTQLSRRALVKLGAVALTESAVRAGSAAESSSRAVSIFDGRTLDGWIQIENSATSISIGGILDPTGFASKLTAGSDPVSEFLSRRLTDSLKTQLAAYSPSGENAKTVLSALVKELNPLVSGPSIYDSTRFGKIVLRTETKQLLLRDPAGQQLARLNKMLLEDAYPMELAKSAETDWIVKNGAMASSILKIPPPAELVLSPWQMRNAGLFDEYIRTSPSSRTQKKTNSSRSGDGRVASASPAARPLT
jgi:hypothetical protein